MTADGWFLISMMLCLIGACTSIFAVSTRKALNIWVALGFGAGALLNALILFITTVRPH